MQVYSKSLSAVLAASMLAGSVPGFAKDTTPVVPSVNSEKVEANPADPKQMSPIQLHFTEYLDGKLSLAAFGTMLLATNDGEEFAKNIVLLRMTLKARELNKTGKESDLKNVQVLNETLVQVLLTHRKTDEMARNVVTYGLTTLGVVVGGRIGYKGGFNRSTEIVNSAILKTARSTAFVYNKVADAVVTAAKATGNGVRTASNAVSEQISKGATKIGNNLDFLWNGSKEADVLFKKRLGAILPNMDKVELQSGYVYNEDAGVEWIATDVRGLEYRIVTASINGQRVDGAIAIRVAAAGDANGVFVGEKYIVPGNVIFDSGITSEQAFRSYAAQLDVSEQTADGIFKRSKDQVIKIFGSTGRVLAVIPTQASKYLNAAYLKAVEYRAGQVIVGATIGGASGLASAAALDYLFIEDPFRIPGIREQIQKDLDGLNLDAQLK